MPELTLEQNIFDPVALIKELSLEMKTFLDADGNTIPNFEEFMNSVSESKKVEIAKLNEETIREIASVYHTVIYARPRPLPGDPFQENQLILEKLLSDTLEKEKNIDLTSFTVDLGNGARFNPTKAEMYDPENKESDYRKNELKKYLDFRKKNNL